MFTLSDINMAVPVDSSFMFMRFYLTLNFKLSVPLCFRCVLCKQCTFVFKFNMIMFVFQLEYSFYLHLLLLFKLHLPLFMCLLFYPTCFVLSPLLSLLFGRIVIILLSICKLFTTLLGYKGHLRNYNNYKL